MARSHQLHLLVTTVLLLALSACLQTKEHPSGGAEDTVDPPFWVRLADVAARIEIVELLDPRFETMDGLRPPDPINLNDHRRYQVAIARVQHDYLPNTSPQLAFVVNFTLDGSEHESVRDPMSRIDVGDTGVIFGMLEAGTRRFGSLGNYYDQTWSLPALAPSVRYLRDTVISMRQTGHQIEALNVNAWCEYSAGWCENARTGWSETIPEFEAMMEAELAQPRVPTPEPNSSYP